MDTDFFDPSYEPSLRPRWKTLIPRRDNCSTWNRSNRTGYRGCWSIRWQLFHVEQVLSDMPTPNYMTMAKCTSCMPRTRAYRIATVRVSAKGYSIGFIRPIHKNTLCGTTRRLLSPIRGKYEPPLKTRPIPIDEPQSNGPWRIRNKKIFPFPVSFQTLHHSDL